MAGDAALLLGEQGAPAGPEEIDAHLAYWAALDGAVREGLAQARDATAPPPTLPGIEPARSSGRVHALNWQRAWRQAEDEALR